MNNKNTKEFDELVKFIRENMKECSDVPLTPIESRHEQFDFVAKVLETFFPEENGYKLTVEKPDKFHSYGTISIEGRDLVFNNPIWLSRICEFADNSEIYPLLNGNIRMSFMFFGMAK